MRPSSKSNSEFGASMVEFAIVLPLLLIFLMGFVELGRVFSQRTWFSNVSYFTALSGADAGGEVSSEAMSGTFQRLYDVHLEHGYSRMDYGRLKNSPHIDSANKLVTVSSEGKAQKILNYLPMTMNIDYVGPMLGTSGTSAGDLGKFSNESGNTYDCYGTKNGNSGVPCGNLNPAPPPPPAGNTCFSGEAPITMADGSQKPISAIVVGDIVFGFDEKEKRLVTAKVTTLFTRKVNSYYLLNSFIKVTGEHPFYVNGQWKKVKDLEIGDRFQSYLGSEIALATKENVQQDLDVYNIEVDGVHDYYAYGILVHNKSGDPYNNSAYVTTTAGGFAG